MSSVTITVSDDVGTNIEVTREERMTHVGVDQMERILAAAIYEVVKRMGMGAKITYSDGSVSVSKPNG